MKASQRPDLAEYHEYYRTYVGKVPDGDVLTTLGTGLERSAALLAGQPASFGDRRSAPGKWTVREILAHVIDTERTFGFRAFWFARGGTDPLPGMDQDAFTAESGASSRTLEGLVTEWRAVRAANLALFEAMSDEASLRTGIASGNRFTARSLAWIITGHEIHHRQQLEAIVSADAPLIDS